MAMKPSLALRLGQQLRMTPQLQQAIKLLQLSTLDLQQEIQEALDSNLMLEELASDDEHGDEPTSLDSPTDPQETELDKNRGDQLDTQQSDADQAGAEEREFDTEAPDRLDPEIDGDYQPDTSDELASDKIPDELPVDSVWEDVWDEAPLPGSYSGGDDNDDNYIDTRNAVSASLQSHLEEQLNLLHLSDVDEMIAMAIVDGLDKNGVLTIPLEDVLISIPDIFECEMDEVLAVLHRIQHLDPIGVAARDLRECLIIQLKFLPTDTPWRSQAITVVSDYLSSLANRDYALLIRKTRL
ncbi:MAG: RNA polymerase sigma-54 factor, partial [Urechidicola sp.]